MKLKSRIAAILATTGMVGSLAVITASGAGATTAATKKCDDGHWPASGQGRPSTLQDGASQGVYAWHDNDGWHLRVTHPGHDKVVFTGRIESSARIEAGPPAAGRGRAA